MWHLHKKIMIAIFVFAFLARVGFSIGGVAAQGPTHPYGDTDGRGYHNIANNLLAGRGFSLNDREPFTPTQWRQPFYPLFLAGLYSLGISPVAVGIIQNALGAGTAVLIFIAGISWFGFNRRTAAAASLLFAFEPYIAYLSARYTPEVFAMPLILVATWATFAVAKFKIQNSKFKISALAGLLWGLAALTRASALYLPMFLAVAIAIAQWRRLGYRRALLHTALFLAVFGVTISPWILRNHARFDTWSFSDLGSSVAFHQTYAYVEADRLGMTLGAFMYELGKREAKDLAGATPEEKIRYWDTTVRASIMSEPLRYVKVVGIYLFPFFVTDGLNNIFAIGGFDVSAPVSAYNAIAQGRMPTLPSAAWPLMALRGIWMLWTLTISLLALRGIIIQIRSKQYAAAAIFAIVIGVTAGISALSSGLPRYRHAIEPLMFLLACIPGAPLGWREKLRARLTRLFSWIQKKFGIDASYYARGGGYTMLTYVVQIGLGALTSILMARYLPREIYGGWRYLLGVVGTLGILALPGMGVAMTQSIARGFDGAYVHGIKTTLKWSLLASVGLLTASAVPSIYHTQEIQRGLWLLAALFPFYAASPLYGVLLAAKQDLRRQFWYGTIYRVALTAGTVAALVASHSLIIFALVIFCADIISRGTLTLIARRFTTNRTTDPAMVPYGIKLSAIDALPIIAQQIDKLVIPATLGLPGLALYAVATMIPDQAKEFGSAIVNLSLPKLSRWRGGKDDHTFIKRVFFQMLAVSIAAIALYAAVTRPIIHLVFPTYPDAVNISIIYAATLVFFPTVLITNWFQAQKKVKQITLYNTASATAQIVGTIVLVPFFGIMGAVAARALSRMTALIVAWGLFARSSER